jgi:hypothetical protein
MISQSQFLRLNFENNTTNNKTMSDFAQTTAVAQASTDAYAHDAYYHVMMPVPLYQDTPIPKIIFNITGQHRELCFKKPGDGFEIYNQDKTMMVVNDGGDVPVRYRWCELRELERTGSKHKEELELSKKCEHEKNESGDGRADKRNEIDEKPHDYVQDGDGEMMPGSMCPVEYGGTHESATLWGKYKVWGQ